MSGTEVSAFPYESFVLDSLINESACVTAAEDGMTCTGLSSDHSLIQDTVYGATFDPAAPATNELTTDSASPFPTGSIGVTIAPHGHYLWGVSSATSGGACPGFQITLTAGKPWATSLPSIQGSGGAVSTTDASYGGPTTTLTRQWMSCDSTGSACTAISGQTASTLPDSAVPAAGTVRVRDIATDASGASTVDSLPTAVVVEPGQTKTITITITITKKRVCKPRKVHVRVHGKRVTRKRRVCHTLTVRKVQTGAR